MRLPTPDEAKDDLESSWRRLERGNETYIYGDGHADAALESEAYLGRLLYLRILAINLELCDGDLEAISSQDLATSSSRYVMKQTTTLEVIEKIVRASINRHLAEGIKAADTRMEHGELMRARWKYIAMAELASIVVEFEQNPWFKKRWRKPVEGGLELKSTLFQRLSLVCDLLERSDEAAAFLEARSNNTVKKVRRPMRPDFNWRDLPGVIRGFAKEDGITIT